MLKKTEIDIKKVIHESLEFFHRYNPGSALLRGAEALYFVKTDLIHPIIDIGCGDGAFGGLIVRLKQIVFDESTKIDTGVDIRITKFRNSEAYHQVLETDAISIPFPDEYFMTVISNCVMEHIVDIEPTLEEINRVLKKGGKFYFTVPSDYFNGYFMFVQFFTNAAMPGIADRLTKRRNRRLAHYHIYTVNAWRQILKRTGFRLVNQQYIIPQKMHRVAFLIFDFYNCGFGRIHIGDFIRAFELLTYKLFRIRPISLAVGRLLQTLFTLKDSDSMSSGAGFFLVAEKEKV